MKVIHSLWTKPMLEGQERWNISNQLKSSIWLYAHSLNYAHSIGLEIDLYTDEMGAEILGFLPYQNVHVCLEELDNYSERFWSAGKILALEKAAIGSIHIDGDVFLKKPEIIPLLNIGNADCIVQMEERQDIFIDSYKKVLPMFKEVLKHSIDGFGYNHTSALNAGVLGFQNEQLKYEYIQGYWKMLDICQSNPKFMQKLAVDTSKRIEPNIVMEQYYLKSLCAAKGYHIKYLLDVQSDNFKQDTASIQEQANQIGYAHAWGASKYQIIPQVKHLLHKSNPELYGAIVEQITRKKEL